MINELSLEYAKALFDLSNNQEEDLNNLASLSHVLQDNSINKTLMHPIIDKDAKKEIFTNVFKNKTSDIFIDFIYVLIDNDRLDIVNDIQESFSYLLDLSKGHLNVKIYYRQELKDEQIEKIISFLKNKYQVNEVSYDLIKDDNLTIGVKIKAGNDLLDATIDDQLSQIKELIS